MNTSVVPSNIRRRFLRLTFINILSNVTVPLAGLVDTAMLGHLPDIRFLAGVALAAVLFDLIYWTFGFLRMGTTGTTAQAIGRRDHDAVFLTLYRSVVLALGVATVVLALQWPLREIGFALLSGSEGVEAAGRAYFNARIWGAPATLCNFVLLGWFLGREQSKHALVMTVAANLSNIVLNYIFIIRLNLAAQGAGLATMASQYVMVAVGVALFLAQGKRLAWNWRAVGSRSQLWSLMRLNWNILVRTLCLVLAFSLFTNFSSIMGTIVLAANSVLLRLFTLAAYMIDGAAFATESLAGIFRGQRSLAALRYVLRLSMIVGLAFTALVLGVLFAAPRTLFGLLTSHLELIELATRYAPWLIPVLLFGALAFMYDGLFLGLTEGRMLRNAMLVSFFAGFLPLALAGIWTRDNHLLWSAMATFMMLRTWTLWAASRKLMVRFSNWSTREPA